MRMLEEQLKYTKEHEWLLLEETKATVGITSYATDELGEIVYLELPDAGSEFEQMDECGSIESVKTLSNIFIPMSGQIAEINEDLISKPSMINDDPYNEGWLIKLDVKNPNEYNDLMSYAEYKEYLNSL